MYQQDYYVLKESGTYSNALEAFGLATVLGKMIGERAIKLSDEGVYFCIHLNKPVTENMVSNMDYFQSMPYIKVKNDTPEHGLAIVVDYEMEKQKKDNFSKFIQELQKQKPADMNQQIENYEPKPNPDYDIFSAIYQLKALEGYKKVVLNILRNKGSFPVLLKELLYLYSKPEDLCEQSVDRLKKLERQGNLSPSSKVNSLQLFNPHKGKGVNEPKANRLANKNLSAFWLREWMKLVGSYKAMTIKAVQINNRSWDTKIYVLYPRSIDFNQLMSLHVAFKPKLRGLSAVKLDIASLLSFCRIFVENISEYQEKKKVFSALIKPHHFINGFYTTYLKDLGQNKAVSNLSFLQLPTFIEVGSYDDGQMWIQILLEHQKITGTLREDTTGSCIQMLHNYRQFLTSSDIEYFFEFLVGYSVYLIQEITKDHHYVRPFSLKLMEELLMRTNKPLSLILQSEGFKNMATAIRNSTIGEQIAKSKGRQQFDIHYGMAQDLKRKSAYPDELIQYLSDFVASYNAETARFIEKNPNKVHRPTIKQQDIDEVINLIDGYGSNTIGKLLAAYGYALDREQIQKPVEESLMEVENV